MTNILYGIGVTLLAAFVGSILGGTIEDIAWAAGGQALPNCDQIEGEEWREHCFTVYEKYYSTKALYQALGGLVPLFTGMGIVYQIFK